MKHVVRRVAFCALALSIPSLFAEDADQQPKLRHFVIGARAQWLPLPLFKTDTTTAVTTKPVAQYTYTGSSSASRFAPAVTFEYRITHRFSIGVEAVLQKIKFQQTTDLLSGIRDPNASTDDRKSVHIISNTKAAYWEAPLLARYHFFQEHGILKYTYIGGGGVMRRPWRIRTTNDYTFPDSTTGSDTAAVRPATLNQFGGVAVAGLRFVDPVGVKVMPEVRFTRWNGYSFQGGGYRSAHNEISVGLGLSF